MRVLLRKLAIWVLAGELEERAAHARKLAEQAYQGRHEGGKRGRVWWAGYEQALVAVRESRRSL